MPVLVIYITAALLFAAIFPLPEMFYTYLKIVAGGTFAWGAYTNFLKKTPILPWVYALFAVIFNPVMEISLARPVWIGFDLVAGIMLLLTKRHIAE